MKTTIKLFQHSFFILLVSLLLPGQPLWGQQAQDEEQKLHLRLTNRLPEGAVPDADEVYDLHIEFSKKVKLDSSSIDKNFLNERRAGGRFSGFTEPGQESKTFDFEIKGNDPAIKSGEFVDLKFVNPDGAEVKKWWWTSKDNTGKHGMRFKRAANAEEDIEYEYDGKTDHENRKKYQTDGLGVLSVLPDPWRPREGGAYVAIQPDGRTTDFYTPDDIARLEKSLYGDAALFEQLFDRLGGEFSTGIRFGDPVVQAVKAATIYDYGIYGEINVLPRTRVFLRIGQNQQAAEARLDLRTADFENGETRRLDAFLRTEMHNLSLGAGLKQYFGQNRIRPYLGAGIYLQHLMQGNTELVIEDIRFPHEKQLRENHLLIRGNAGVSCLIGDNLILSLEANPVWQQNQSGQSIDIGGSLQTGFQF